MVALLVARAAVNIADNKGGSPLYYAALQGHVDILKLLIKAKGDINQVTKEGGGGACGSSPLMIASGNGLAEVVELFLSNGADVHLKEKDGPSALDFAIGLKHPAVEAVLRAHIAQLEAARERGEGGGCCRVH